MTNALPPALASRQRRSIIDDVAQGLGASRGAHISIRGGRFRLISATGVETLINTHYLDVIVIDANDKPARVYFEGEFDPNADTPPMCFSDNGTGPSTQAMMPQAPTCVVCPHNVRGSAQTFTQKPTTACDNRKKVAVIIPDDPAVNVYEFQIPPGSLGGLKAYTGWIRQQASGVEGRALDIADFVTRVEFDPDRQFVMKFTPIAFADDDRTLQLIEYIDANKLSDAAVGRLDVAHDPQQVQAILAGATARQQIAAPAPAAQAPQDQQFTLPPRTNGAALPAPAANAAPAAPPKPRGRKAAETPPAGAGAAAPFMAPAAQAAGPAQAQFAAPTPPAAATQTAASPSNGAQPPADGIPDFLRRKAEAPAPSGGGAPPRFGVGQAPPPPEEIAAALNQVMQLPTRRG